MPSMPTVIAVIHVLAAIIWVGGMFFAHMALRPAIDTLEPPQRLTLWSRVFPHFFAWVWAVVIALPATGYARIYLGYDAFADAAVHMRIMHQIGLGMIVLFVFLYFVPYQRFKKAVAAEDWDHAAINLRMIRRIVVVNLLLGLITASVGASGRAWY